MESGEEKVETMAQASAESPIENGLPEDPAPSTDGSSENGPGKVAAAAGLSGISSKFFRIKITGPGPNDVMEHEIEAGVRGIEVLELVSTNPDLVTRPRVGLYIDGVAQSTLADISLARKPDGETTVIEVRPEPYSYLDAVNHVRQCVDIMMPDLTHNAIRGAGIVKSVLKVPAGSTLDDHALQGMVSGKDVLAHKCDEVLTGPMYTNSLEDWVPNLTMMEDIYKKYKVAPSIKDLSLSRWNPPTMRARMQGDLVYLRVVTLEGNILHITGSSSGFFLSRSTDESFDRQPTSEPYNCHSLDGCLKMISPQFRSNFEVACRSVPSMMMNRHWLPLAVPPWAAAEVDDLHQSVMSAFEFKQAGALESRITTNWEITGLCQKAFERYHEDPTSSDMLFYGLYLQFLLLVHEGSQLMVEGSVNEMCPLSGLLGNIVFTSVESDCESFELEGGEAAAFASARLEVRGQELVWNVLRRNTAEKRVLPMAPQVCIDYRGHRLVAQSIIPGLLDQDFGDDFHKFVLHGFTKTKDVQTLAWSQEAHDTLGKVQDDLLSKPHRLYDENGEIHEYNTSSFVKTMAGSDGRKYFFEFTRACPVDANFVDIHEGEDKENAKKVPVMPHKLFFLRPELVSDFMTCRRWAFLKVAYNLFDEEYSAAHGKKDANGTGNDAKKETVQTQGEPSTDNSSSLSSTRDDSSNSSSTASADQRAMSDNVRSLVQDLNTGISRDATDLLARSHNSTQTMDGKIFSTMAAAMANSVPYSAVMGDTSGDDTLKSSEEFAQRIIRKAAQLVGSYDDESYRIGFNLDVGNAYASPADDRETVLADRQMVEAASLFLVNTVLLKLVIDVTQLVFNAVDTMSLRDCMHKRGVNMRYLGNLAACAGERPDLWYIKKLCVSDIIMRSAKHIARAYLRKIPNATFPYAFSHFLNCFLSSGTSIKPQKAPTVFSLAATTSGKKHKKKGKGAATIRPAANTAAAAAATSPSATASAAASTSSTDADEYNWTDLTPQKLWSAIVDEAQAYYRFTLGGDTCQASCSAYKIQPISLLRGFCIMMGVQIQSRSYNFSSPYAATFTPNDVINTYPILKYPWFEPAGVEEKWALLHDIADPVLRKHVLVEIIQLYNRTIGLVHPQIARANSSLASVLYDEGDYASAVFHQEEAVKTFEITCGIDNPLTIDAYTVLGRYLFACSQVTLALKAATHARSLLLLVFGPDHPMELAMDRDIGEYLLERNPELALKFLLRSCQLYERYERSDRIADLGHARVQHRVAQCYLLLADYRSSLQAERLVYNTYKTALGEQHPYTQHCAALLKSITAKAVKAEKKLQTAIAARQVSSTEEDDRRELLDLFSSLSRQQNGESADAAALEERIKSSFEAAKRRSSKTAAAATVNGTPSDSAEPAAEPTATASQGTPAASKSKNKKKSKKNKA